MKEGARELLEFLHSRGLPMALATSRGAATTKLKLDHSGLGRYFQSVITGDMVSRGKPHPEIYLTACAALGTAPARTMAVEDSPNGIRSASAAGMPTVMIPDLLPPTAELDGLLWRRFDSLDALREYLRENL